MSTIGMMDGAFFVGRKEIMDWINSTLDMNLSKVEDTANGAVACQLLDIMYPGKVPMHKVNWSAKQSFEFVANYKILQTCFTKLNIERHVDVDRLITGKYMDNLEFMQWYKKFFEMSVSDKGSYDAVAQRSKGKGGAQFGGGKATSSSVSSFVKPTSAPIGAAVSKVPSKPSAVAVPQKSSAKASDQDNISRISGGGAGNGNNAQNNNSNSSNSRNADALAAQNEISDLKSANEESNRALIDLRAEMEGLEKERDFYFQKLRDIEIMMQDLEDKGQGTELSAAVFKILYATADGFEQTNNANDGDDLKIENVHSSSNNNTGYDVEDEEESY